MGRMLAALAFSAVAATAQDAAGTTEGTVTDSATKRPVVGAQVSLTPAGTAADVKRLYLHHSFLKEEGDDRI